MEQDEGLALLIPDIQETADLVQVSRIIGFAVFSSFIESTNCLMLHVFVYHEIKNWEGLSPLTDFSLTLASKNY
jgi:hypothetical protein